MKKEKEEKVFTNWTVKELLGQGAFGKVYRIERQEFGTVYQAAMKKIVIPQSQEDIEDAINEGMDEQSVTSYFRGFVEEIVNEFKLMAQLKGHTNVVSYEDHMVIPHEDGIGWDILIRMELLRSLKSMTSEQNMSEREVIRLGMDICNALELCGKMNIIHRDIKPENIFVTSLGEYKLGDFGIARMAEKTMSNLSKKGTYTYMAPEVYKGEDYDATVDIYSLGIVMYRFMNYNRAPFLPAYPQPISFSDREASLTRRISEERMPAPALGSKELKKIILKACAYRPAERYQSPVQMRSELESLLRDLDRQGMSVAAPVQAVPVMMQAEEEETATAVRSAGQSQFTGQPESVGQTQFMEQPAMPAVAYEEQEEETVSVFGGQTVSKPQNPVHPPVVTAQPVPKKPKKKKTGLFIAIGVICGVILALIAAVAFIGGGSSTPPSSDLSEASQQWHIGEDNGPEEAVQEPEAMEEQETAVNWEADSTGQEKTLEPRSNRYLYGHYEMDAWNEGESFFDGMETMTINKRALSRGGWTDLTSADEEDAAERELAVIPVEMTCFPEGTIYASYYNNQLLKEMLEETDADRFDYASRTYLEDESVTGEDIFEVIAGDIFGDEILPQVHDFYEEQIKGQRDTVELVLTDGSKHRESLLGFYKMDGPVMDLAYLDLDEEGKLVLQSLKYEFSFSGKNLNISSNGVTRTMTPFGAGQDRVQLFGYINSEADAYEGISSIYFYEKNDDEVKAALYFTDGWRTDDAAAEIGPGNKLNISWQQQAKLGDPYQKRESAGTLQGTYLDCSELGLILSVDGRDYFYQKTETEYYANLLGESVIDAELEEQELQEMSMTQMEMLEAIKEACDATGYFAPDEIKVNEKTGRITLDNGILFDVDSSEISEEGKEYLEALFLALEEAVFGGEYEEYLDEIIVEGHTDSSGDYEYNLMLSEERASAVDDYCDEVYSYLSSYLYPVGYASDMPVYDENGNEDREASRRVVFRIKLDADAFSAYES